MKKSKVYFTKEITPQAMIRMYEVLNIDLKGNIGVKLHSRIRILFVLLS